MLRRYVDFYRTLAVIWLFHCGKKFTRRIHSFVIFFLFTFLSLCIVMVFLVNTMKPTLIDLFTFFYFCRFICFSFTYIVVNEFGFAKNY